MHAFQICKLFVLLSRKFLVIIITLNFITYNIHTVNIKSHAGKLKEDVHCAPSLLK